MLLANLFRGIIVLIRSYFQLIGTNICSFGFAVLSYFTFTIVLLHAALSKVGVAKLAAFVAALAVNFIAAYAGRYLFSVHSW